MSALDVIENICKTTLINEDFIYCLVDNNKIPYTHKNTLCHPNRQEDFNSLETLLSNNEIEKYEGVGISIFANNISAIDVDCCIKEPFNINCLDDRAKDIVNVFKDRAYIEFSFSGRGLRVLFDIINLPVNYNTEYYIKNSKKSIEFYNPSFKARYVTITGKPLYNNNPRNKIDFNEIKFFFDKYFKREYKLNINGYIGKEEIDKESTKENINIKVTEKDIFMDYEIYTFEITNNSEKEILLDRILNVGSIYLQDQKELKYEAYNTELTELQLRIESQNKKKIKIKFYNKFSTSRKIDKIIFSDVVLDYDEYKNFSNKNMYKTDQINVEI